MNLLILGDKKNKEVQHIVDVASQNGAFVFVLETNNAQQLNQITYDVYNNDVNITTAIKLSTFDAVYMQSIALPSLAENDMGQRRAPEQQQIMQHHVCCLHLIINEYRLPWFNSWQAFQCANAKPRQLAYASALGARIPQCIISNQPQQILTFSQDKHLLMKPLLKGYSPIYVTTEQLNSDSFYRKLNKPQLFQQIVDGRDVVVYLFDDKLFAVTYAEPCFNESVIDYSLSHARGPQIISLPNNVKQMSRHIMRAMHMKWGAITWRLTDTKEFIFIDASPAPQFSDIQKLTRLPLAENLVEMLFAQSRFNKAQ